MRPSVDQHSTLESSFEKLYNDTPAMLASIDPTGKIVEISDFALGKLGYGKDQIVGKLFFNFLTDESKIYASQTVLPKLLKEGRVDDIQYKVIKQSGAVMDVLMTSMMIKGDSGEFLRTNSVITDITEKNRVAAKLKLSERNYLSLFNSINDIYFRTNESNEIIAASPSFETHFECEPGESLGMKLEDIVTESASLKICWGIIKKYGKIDNWESDVYIKNGRIVTISTNVVANYNSQGKYMGVTGISRNISKRVAAEKRGKDLSKKYEHLFQNSQEAILINEALTQKILETNLAAQNLLEYSDNELSNITVDRSTNNLTDKQRSVLEKGKEVFETDFLTKSKKKLRVEVSAQVLELNGEKIIQSFIRDISKRKYEEVRVKKFNTTLLELLSDDLIISGREEAFKQITSKVSEALEVARVSIWLHDDLKSKIVCQCLYSDGKFTSNQVLHKKDFPEYFKAIEENVFVDADNAFQDSRTREFAASYLKPLGISSMLDAAIWIQGEVVGVICCEHVGAQRNWTTNEKYFLRGISDIITHVEDGVAIRAQSEALKASSTKYANIFDTIIDIYYKTDRHGRITVISPSLEKIMGIKSVDVLGKTGNDFFINKKEYQELKKQLAVNKNLKNFEGTFKNSAGEIRRTSMNVQLEFDEKGAYIGTVGIIRDQTERKVAEDKLKLSEEYLRKAESLANVGNWQFDVLTNRFTCSDQLFNIFGLKRRDDISIGQMLKLVHPEDIERANESLLKLSSGVPIGIENGRIIVNKKVKYVETVFELKLNKDGEVVRLFGTIQDVTVSRLLKIELQTRNKRLTVMSKVERVLTRFTAKDELALEICKALAIEYDYPLVEIGLSDETDDSKLILIGGFSNEPKSKCLELNEVRAVSDPEKEAIAKMKPISIGDLSKLKKFMKWKSKMLASEFQSFVSVPFSYPPNVCGVLNIYAKTKGENDNDNLEFLKSVVTDLALGLHSKKVQEEKEQLFDFNERLLTSLNVVSFESDFIAKTIQIRGDAQKVLGYSLEDLDTDLNRFIGKIHPNDAALIKDKIDNTTASNLDFEYRFRQSDGTYNWIHSTDQINRNEKGELVSTTGIIISIDELKNEEENQIRAEILGRDKERKRISQEIHDSLGQTLTVASMSLDAIQLDIKRENKKKRSLVQGAKELVDFAIKEAREISHDLMPSSLIDFGLIPSLESDLKKIRRTNDINFSFYHHNVPEELNDELKINLYRIIKEAINNILKHSEARTSSIQLVNHDDWLILMIEDDGVGFDQTQNVGGKGMGLINLKNRVKSLQGELYITSEKGVLIIAEIPLK